MRLPKSITTFFFLLCFTFASCAQSPAVKSPAEKIRQLLDEYNRYKLFNGTALVAKDGKVIFKNGVGYANFEWEIRNTPDTRFRLGSITKQFTAMLILQLAEQGKLKLDGHISDYLPYYPKANGERVTIYNLLTHTSGIPNYTARPDFFSRFARNPSTPKEFIPFFSELPLEFTPGTDYKYSNSGYFVLGAIIEEVTGQSYASVLQERIFTPLHMLNTGYDKAAPIIKKRAAGYERNGDSLINASYLDMDLPYAAGAMYSTVEDLYLWDQALYTNQLLSAAGKTTYFTPFLKGYACGWMRQPFSIGNTKDTLSSISHDGGINGFNTLIVRIPDSKDLVVLLNNTGGAPLRDIAKNILAILYNKPYTPPAKPTHSLSQPAAKTLAAITPDTAAYRLYTGKYELAPNVVMAISTEGDHIYEQLTGQARFEIFPSAPAEFFMKVVDARISFMKNEQGVVDQLVLHQNGRDITAKRVE
ncbi:CubicO group peptidase, beta-lactamase class C family [Chitinophaga rupis]|uniref:CubicO group peptidase, beta-lactamase class C family n=1 Tax=Chitinophaga rupis TaxID=573321 RepID=A0A1H7SRI7_9BACT|nr:serine hydrolase [Chitinophaga rupis]SEL75133.1 CubicO group peptidase, beta-lactamase class C family [Chitinophaga rupis]